MLRRLTLSLALGLAVLALLAAPAAAQQYPDNPPVDVLPDVGGEQPQPGGEQPQGEEVAVAGDEVRRSLPVTGGDLLGLAAIGAGAFAVGGVLVAQRRRASA